MACRLALVSSHINALSRAARYQTVTLVAGSAWQIRTFIESLTHERSAARAAGSTVPHVRHLRLSLVSFLEAHLSPCAQRHLSNSAFEHWKTLRAKNLGQVPDDPAAKENWRKFNEDLARSYHGLVERLLRIVAPRVETLCLFGHGSTHHQEFYLLGCWKCPPGPLRVNRFPHLRELSFAGDEPRLIKSDRTPALTVSPVSLSQSLFPVLERLHIAAHATNRVNVRHWVAAAPALKDLRVTLGLWDMVRTIPVLFFTLIWVLSEYNVLRRMLQMFTCPCLENRNTEECPVNPIVRIASMSMRIPDDESDEAENPLSVEDFIRERFLDELGKHVRSRANEPAVFVRDYGLQDMRGDKACGLDYIWWRHFRSLNTVVGIEWLGGLESSIGSGRRIFRESCWYVPFDWKSPDKYGFSEHDTRAVCIKNFEIEAGRK